MRPMIEIRFNERLKERGKTLYWLSQQSGVRYATIWGLNRGGVGRLSLDVLDRICEALECQPGDILTRVPSRKSKASQAKKARKS